ncbi:ATP-binding protein [Cellvibrio mixtus]|uniref:ATP-binding protein n=1 Tax=Cellvibrio mixtus TaxID=39650 RepID=UPI000A773EFA
MLTRTMNSIQQRLSLGLISVLIITGLVLAQLSLWLFDQGLRRYLQTHLHHEAQTLLAAIIRGANGIELDQQRVSASYQRPFSGEYFVVVLPDQQWRSRSSWDYQVTLPATTGLQKELADGPQAQELLIYRADFRRYGKAIQIIAAQDYTPMLKSFRTMQWSAAGIGLGALILLVLIQRILVRRALRPLEQMREQIVQLQQGQRTELDQQVPDELVPLVQQLNHLLQHTEDTLGRSRNALGNLGHALKTPLAILFSLANRHELNAHPELRDSFRQQLQSMQERISRELGRARLAGEALPGAYFECARELPDLCSTLQQIHRRDLQLGWQAESGLRLPWDREDILELLGNLLDNACKWAHQKIQIGVTYEQTHYCITIDDDGPGIAAELREQVMTRGARIDEQVQGHGLGLGIVRDIVEHCRGELVLDSSPLGGLRVIIRLPVNRV